MSLTNRFGLAFHTLPAPCGRPAPLPPHGVKRLPFAWAVAVSAFFFWGSAVSDISAAPLAVNDSVQVDHNGTKEFSVLANDDGQGATLDCTTLDVVTQPAHGSVEIEAMTGAVTYTVTDDCFAGHDSFRYTVRDQYGQLSNTAEVDVHVAGDNAPQIVNFSVTECPDNHWRFEGNVGDEHPLGMTITFGGLLQGHATGVDDGGHFTYDVVLETEEGLVTAQTSDCQGLRSNVAEDSVERS